MPHIGPASHYSLEFAGMQQAAGGYHAAHHHGECCGDGSSRNSPTQHQNGNQVAAHIEYSGREEDDKGSAAVTQCTQDAEQNIEQQHDRDAQKGAEQIGIGRGHYLLRGLHPTQNGPAEQCAGHHEQYGDAHREQHAIIHIGAHAVVLLGTKSLRNGYAHSSGQSRAEAQYEKQHRTAGSHACQSIGTQKTSHDGGIHQGVKLLQEIAAQQGQRKGKYQGGRPPHGHILRHSYLTSAKCLHRPAAFLPPAFRFSAAKLQVYEKTSSTPGGIMN